jgi:hypothetical protein
LKKRLTLEPSSAVKASIQRSLAQLGPAEPGIGSGTKYYLAVGATSHTTGRSNVPSLVRAGMSKVAGQLGTFAMAPGSESADQAKSVFQQHASLKGFYLAPKVSVIYAGDRLTIRLSVAMLSYPEKNMLGQMARTMASPGVSSPDPGLEDELIGLAAEAAMKQFAQVAANY